MPDRSSDYSSIEGIIDVGIIVIAHFRNPVQDEMIDFLKPVLSWKKRIVIPNTVYLGAFHILTSYLRTSKIDAKNALLSTFGIQSPCYISDIQKSIVSEALEQATCYNVESWDGYLVSLGKMLDTDTIYSVDKKLSRVKEINVINPVEESKMKTYHEWVSDRLK